MDKMKSAVITQGTSVIFPHYDEDGKLGAKVLQNGDILYVDITPTQLIDLSLRYYGTSLRGAIEGSKMMLGDISMPPLVVSEKLGLYWFPSRSSSCNRCVWLSAGHIDSFLPIDKEHTQVFLTSGAWFAARCSYSSFEKKYQRACTLKKRMEGWTNRAVVCEKRSSYVIRLDGNKRNYEVNKE